MEIESLSNLIKKSLEYYDSKNLEYLEIINSHNVTINKRTNNIIIYSGEKEVYSGDFEILGYFDNQSRVWMWGWMLPTLDTDKTIICRYLLDYGLKLEPESNMFEHFLIKSLLVNSRILIQEDSELDVNIALYSYLVKNKHKFIYPRKVYLDDSKKNYIIVYYLVK